VLVFGSLFRDEKIVFIVLGLLFLFVLFFVFISLRIVRNLLKKTLNYKYLRKIGDFSLRLYDSIIEYKKYRSALGKVLLISCGIQASRILGIYVVGLSIGITLSIQYYMIIVPVVIVITLIPVTVAGLGLREISFIYLFEQIGFSGTAAFTLSILIDLIILLLSLIGGVIYFIKGFSPTKEKA
jgi:uncharacterized protein (TIRG00374 family)